MSELINSIKAEFNLSEKETGILNDAFEEISRRRYHEVFVQEREAAYSMSLLTLINTLSKDRAVPYTNEEIKGLVAVGSNFFLSEVNAYARIKAIAQTEEFDDKFNRLTLAAWSEPTHGTTAPAW